MQHVEEAGIHSGDSACVLPPHSLGGEMLDADPRADGRDRAGARRRRPAQRAVRGRRRQRALRDRGESARLAHGAVRLQGDRPAARQARLPDHARGADRRPRPAGRPDERALRRGQGGGAAVQPLLRRRLAARPGDALDRRGDGDRARTSRPRSRRPRRRPGAALPDGGTVFVTVTDTDKAGGRGDRRAAARPRLRDRRDARARPQAIQRMGVPVRTLRKVAEGSPHVVDAIASRGGRPGDQHADRVRRALGRLGDPPRRDRARDPVHHDARPAARRRRARSGRPREGEPAVVSLQEVHAAMTAPVRAPRAAPSVARAPDGRALRRAAAAETSWRDAAARPVLHARRRGAAGVGGTASGRSSARAVSVMRPATDGLVEFLLEDVGPGTRRLCELAAGEGIAARRARSAAASPNRPRDALLVGGGIGIAPLLAVQERWGGRRALLGFRDAEHADGAPPSSTTPRIATDDGSRGHHGLVTELLDAELSARARSRLRVRSARDARRRCGDRFGATTCRPNSRSRPRWRAVSAPATAASSRPSTGYRRACVDGPVFRGGGRSRDRRSAGSSCATR